METQDFTLKTTPETPKKGGKQSSQPHPDTIFPDIVPVNFPDIVPDNNANEMEINTEINSVIQYFPKVSLRFHLYNTKSTNPTNILCYARLNNLKEQFNIHLKCYPADWNKETQTASINVNNPLTLKNNVMLNYVINQFQILKSQFVAYICKSQNTDEVELFNLFIKQIKNIINIYTMKNGKQKEKITEYYNVIKALREQCYKRNESTQNQYLSMVNGLESYLKENNISDNLYDFDYTTIFNFKVFLENGEKRGYSRCLVILKCIKTLIKEIGNNPNYKYDYDPKIASLEINGAKEIRTLEDKQKKQVALSDIQLKALREMELTNPMEKQARDVFLLLCATGIRYSDLTSLLKTGKLIDNDGNHCVRFLDCKEGRRKKKMNYVNAPLFLEDYAEALWESLCNQEIILNTSNETYFNTLISRIAKKSGAFDKRLSYINARGKRETPIEYERVSSHSGRHTFISRQGEKFLPEELIVFTGHSDTRCIENNYLHRSEKLADGQLARVTSKLTTPIEETQPQHSDNNLIDAVRVAVREEITTPKIKELEGYKELFSEDEKYDRIAEMALYNDVKNVRRDFIEEGN